MANITRNFTAGKMNKVVDERLIPDGQYIDAMNVRMGSTENSEIGVVENTKGNLSLTALTYIDGTPLSVNARCIGAFADGANETLYWFVHDPDCAAPVATGKLDLIVSYNTLTTILTYHVISVDNGTGLFTTLNFNPSYLITGVNKIGDLLFFTDDYNQPRFINVTRSYPIPVSNIDAGSLAAAEILAESLLVIKRPPAQSPTIQLIQQGDQNNYLETRFVSFAYRYRYIDGEYSATSQWSDIAFSPSAFRFSSNSYLNEGMKNTFNTAIVSYDTGGELVVGIDLLFKQSDNNIIKVIEKLDKDLLGLPDNSIQTFSFNNSKIFTILSEAEILRLYDNVPRLAKAQTVMGNRLMYGNYVEGYDLITKYGSPTRLEYQTDLESVIIGFDSMQTSSERTLDYTIDPLYPITAPGGFSVLINPIENPLIAGSSISIEVNIVPYQLLGSIGAYLPPSFDVTFSFTLPVDYPSTYAMVTSNEFQSAVGTSFNILPVYSPILGDETSCDGITFTDQVNCAWDNIIQSTLYGDMYKYQSGITSPNEPISVYLNSTSSNNIIFEIPAMQYAIDPNSPSQYVTVYPAVRNIEAYYQSSSSPKSLHSNRGYEIGIVYMDEFNRATTALVSQFNTEHVPCEYSWKQNRIRVTIPPTQIAPRWAKRYKFVCKASEHTYETIYSSVFFTSATNNNVYFLLEGENMRKVETGDRYIVKRDTGGPLNYCAYATVLEKQAQEAGFITTQEGVDPPAGVYMKINPDSFQAEQSSDSIIDPGQITTNENNGGQCPVQFYPMNIYNGVTWVDYTVPAGTVITMSFKFQRLGTGDGDNKCEKRIYTLDVTLNSSEDYDNMYDWWIGDNVASVLNSGTQDVGGDNCPIDNVFETGFGPPSNGLCTNYFRFDRDSGTNQLWLKISGTERCPGATSKDKRRSTIITKITVFRADNLLVFETLPVDTLPDVFFENNLSFPIDNSGNHLSNGAAGDISQDISLGISAEIQTGFYNCFSFGNGIESYKIRDSIIGRTFNLGQRVTSVSAQDYKEADRYADMTYSGVYNQETNVNKLNEFNLGLLNYKNLETSFGEIFVLDGRQTDVLVLQEDKISYVLAGKNLLSDAAAGSAITSVPEVLGTQIARDEKYGITFNPESYVHWGYDRFFTDAKRGAVIQLKGDSYSNERLNVVSELGMRTWFRDTFIGSFNTQKIGGFDPYMNEYVLSMNDIELPVNDQCLNCGKNQALSLFNDAEEAKVLRFCVDLGGLIGDVDVSWVVNSITEGSTFDITAEYTTSTTSSGYVNASGSFTFSKDVISEETVDIEVSYYGSIVLSLYVSCPIGIPLNIVEVVITSASDVGKSIHTELRYTDGTFIGPIQSTPVLFGSGSPPIVSRYNIMTGFIGSGLFPTDGSTMFLRTNKISPDNYDFLLFENSFRYLRTNTLYNNTLVDINNLLLASTYVAPNLINPNLFNGSFTVPPTIDGDYLYLIWDLRNKNVALLCDAPSGATEAELKSLCCDCGICSPEVADCVEWSLTNVSSVDTATVYFPSGDCETATPVEIQLDPSESVIFCARNTNELFQVNEGNVIVTLNNCGCGGGCTELCQTWVAFSLNNEDSSSILYYDCDGSPSQTQIVSGGYVYYFCTPIGSPPGETSGELFTIQLVSECGCCPAPTCNVWEVTNDDGAFGCFTYYDCDGVLQTYCLEPSQSVQVCVINDGEITSVPIIGNKWTAVLIDGCGCSVPPPPGFCEYFEEIGNFYPTATTQLSIGNSLPLIFQGNDWRGTSGNQSPRFDGVNNLTSDPSATLIIGNVYYVEIQLSTVCDTNINFWLGSDLPGTSLVPPDAVVDGSLTTPQGFYITYNETNPLGSNFGCWFKRQTATTVGNGYNGIVTFNIGVSDCP